MGVRKKFSTGRQSRHFACPFQAADDINANRSSHNALPLLHHKENDPRYSNSPRNALRWQQCFFSHRIKLLGSNFSFQFSHRINVVFHIVTYCYQQSLPRCITCHRCLRSTATCNKTPTAATQVNLCCHIIVTR